MQTKVCARCKQERDVSEFNKNKRYKDGYQSYCNPCMKEYRTKWYPENAERISKKSAERYRNDDEFRKQANERNNKAFRERYHADPEFRKKKNQWHVDKMKVDPDYKTQRRAMSLMARRMRKMQTKNTEGNFTAKEWKALREKYDNRCLRCGKKTKLTPDHIIPVSLGGNNTIDNIQPLCGPCNSSKQRETTDYRE